MTQVVFPAVTALFLTGIFLNAAAGVVSVDLLESYPALTLTWLRYVSMVLLFLPFALRSGSVHRWPAGKGALGLIPLGITSLAALACFLVALKGMPVATATGLFFCYPFLAVILSVLLLNERAPLRAWLRVVAGLGGVMLLLRPFAATPDLFALAALASGVFVAAKTILTRRMGLSLPLLTVAAGEAVVAAVLLVPFLEIEVLLSPTQEGRLFLYLVLANAARLALVLALSRGRVAMLAPLAYLELAFTAALQVALIGTVPGLRDLVAFAVILAAGLLFRDRDTPSPARDTAKGERAP